MTNNKQKVSEYLNNLVENYYKNIEYKVISFVTDVENVGKLLPESALTKEEALEAFSDGFKQSLDESSVQQSMITIGVKRELEKGNLIDDLGKINYSKYMVNHLEKLTAKTYDETIEAIKINKGDE